jgi:hypothetical protein
MLGGLDAGELSHHGLLGLGDWLLFYRIPFSLSERDRPLHIPQISTLRQMAGGRSLQYNQTILPSLPTTR